MSGINLNNPNPLAQTVSSAANYLMMTERQLLDAVRRGEITYVKVGKYTRFRTNDLEEYIERHTHRARS